MNKQSITFIGMPAAGKTKIGGRVSDILDLQFVDTDELIVDHFNAETLQAVVDKLKPDAFADLEESIGILAAWSPCQIVIATSGSMIHCAKAMRYLHEKTHVVYLQASLEMIWERVAKKPDRGIVFGPGETIADLYARRVPLYEKWAHRTINVDGENRRKAPAELAECLRKEGIV